MPVNRGKDGNGSYYQWGNSGKRYYYISGNVKSRNRAKDLAYKQAKAIYSSGWRERK